MIYFVQINVIFHDFPQPTPRFHDFSGLENEILKFHDFQVFHDLCKPCKVPDYTPYESTDLTPAYTCIYY